jgi:SAM-dependent methyltransferase
MDANIKDAFNIMINKDLVSAVISNSKDKEKSSKIKIRPIELKGELYYQVSEYIGNQIFHDNHTKEELMEKLPSWFEGLFHQAEIISKKGQAVLLISKKGRATVKYKKTAEDKDGSSNKLENIPDEETDGNYQHNKKKNYILQEGISLPFLVDLGVMTKDGAIVKAKMDKYRQINRFLEYIEDVLPYLDNKKELTILDFGCGKSYLTFAIYYFLTQLKGYRVNIIGLDLKTDVIVHCNALAVKYGYDRLKFLQGDIASYYGNDKVDMVVTLHACDTATDYALKKAVDWDARVILSVPCCQHELNGQIICGTLEPVLKYGIIRERMSA